MGPFSFQWSIPVTTCIRFLVSINILYHYLGKLPGVFPGVFNVNFTIRGVSSYLLKPMAPICSVWLHGKPINMLRSAKIGIIVVNQCHSQAFVDNYQKCILKGAGDCSQYCVSKNLYALSSYLLFCNFPPFMVWGRCMACNYVEIVFSGLPVLVLHCILAVADVAALEWNALPHRKQDYWEL